VSGTVATPPSVQAGSAARRAARQAGVEVTDLHEMGELTEAAELFIEVWRTSRAEAPCTPSLLRALAHSGNYVSAAWLGGRMVGASVGFLHPDPSGHPLGVTRTPPAGEGYALHSHITGVRAEAQGRGVGVTLKLHQRAWALARGLPVITWTFDPLVRRNAFLNLVKLGAEIVEYLPDFYGRMGDGINAGDETDRCLVSWPLASERAIAASRGAAPEPDLAALRGAGARVLLEEDAAGRPATTNPGKEPSPAEATGPADELGLAEATGPGIPAVLIQVPGDIVAIRAADPDLASRWRRALRATMGGALARGLAATGITRSGWYVLERASLPRAGQERR
jgi:predicted GNAT superfamily acetyltransferase